MAKKKRIKGEIMETLIIEGHFADFASEIEGWPVFLAGLPGM